MLNRELVDLKRMAKLLPAPRDWLRKEAEEGRIPAIACTGGNYLFHPPLVVRSLVDRLTCEN